MNTPHGKLSNPISIILFSLFLIVRVIYQVGTSVTRVTPSKAKQTSCSKPVVCLHVLDHIHRKYIFIISARSLNHFNRYRRGLKILGGTSKNGLFKYEITMPKEISVEQEDVELCIKLSYNNIARSIEHERCRSYSKEERVYMYAHRPKSLYYNK